MWKGYLGRDADHRHETHRNKMLVKLVPPKAGDIWFRPWVLLNLPLNSMILIVKRRTKHKIPRITRVRCQVDRTDDPAQREKERLSSSAKKRLN